MLLLNYFADHRLSQLLHTRPCDWNGFAVVLVLLRCSVQLDARVLPADWLLAVILLALVLRPLLKKKNKKTSHNQTFP